MKISEIITEGKRPGLWANIHAKRERIKHGSGEHMRKPGSKGAPTAKAFRDSATEDMNEDWGKVNQHDKTDGMSPKAVKAYRREHPGSKLQTAVTTKPSKLKPGSKAAKRRKSFCARMSGSKGPMKDEKGRPTPKAKALRRWNCNESTDMCAVCGQTPCNCTTLHENANPKVDLTPNYPNYSKLVGEFMGVKGERYVFKIVEADVKPGVSETEKIAKAFATGRPIGIEISRVKNRKVVGED